VEVLNNICLNITDCEHKTAPIQEEGISSIRTTDIKNGVIDFKGSNKVSEETYIKWTQRVEPQPYDLILAREAPVGQVGMIPKGYRACLGQRTVLIRPNQQKVYPVYLLYLLLSKEIQHEMKIRASGSTVEHLNMLDIRNLKLPNLPSLKVQQEIGDTLGNLDDKIDNLRRQNETLEEIARSIFKHWFIDFEFPNPDGKPYKSSGGAMVRSDLGDIPEGWGVGKLGDVVSVNSQSIDKNYPHHIIEYVDISSVGIGTLENTTQYKLAEAPSRARRLVEHGDVIWSGVRPNRKSYLFICKPIDNLIVSTGFVVLSPEKIPSSYLYSWVTTSMFVDYLTLNASGSAYPAVKAEHFEIADIILPSISILDKFHLLINPMRIKTHDNSLQIQTLTKTRDALLPRLMSGQLRVEG
jgi:type I restriction enzyme, S subunit